MEIRITIPPDGRDVTVETISMLEDLWHDFQFFKFEGKRLLDGVSSPNNLLLVKRFHRAALLLLMFYLEGVINGWLKRLLSKAEFGTIEKKCLELKIAAIQAHTGCSQVAAPAVAEAKKIRNSLAHLKPGSDGSLYDSINEAFLTSTEDTIVAFLTSMSKILKMLPHLDSEVESRDFREALGSSIPGTEARSESDAPK